MAVESQQKATNRISNGNRSNIASFNVRGLVKPEKRLALAKDLVSYQVDICCLQETKVSEHTDEMIGGYKIILLPSKTRHYGLGFALNKFWTDKLLTYEAISDRIAVATFQLSKRTTMKVVNVYAPTQMLANAKKQIIEEFYEQLDDLLCKINKQTLLFIAGDFNSKIGADWANTACIGHYGRGRQNENGKRLAEFSATHELIATNTMRQHRASHRTTWIGSRLDKKTGLTVPIYNQIDYIFVRQTQSTLVTNARSYSGTAVNSDHRIVVTTSTIAPAYKRFLKNLNKPEKYDVCKLKNDANQRVRYQTELNSKVESWPTNISPFEQWVRLRQDIKTVAKETIGTIATEAKKRCPILEKLSEEQKELRIKIANTQCDTQQKSLKTARNKILDQIHNRVHQINEDEIESRSAEIESLKDSAQMFQAVRELIRGKPKALIVKNSSNETIADPKEAAETIAKHFSNLFFDPQIEEVTESEKKPLNKPITTTEVAQALKKIRNGRAVGPDGIPGELLKYGPVTLHASIANIFNQMFEEGEQLELGRGTLIVLPKPGKPVGLLSSLRPIVLLTTLRKALSLITLQRIRPNIEQILSKSQSGFRQFRSTSDAVWAHKWMIARIMRARDEIIYILGIDMSRAFDTIDRKRLMDSQIMEFGDE